MASADHTEAELQRAWRECALVGVTFQQAMANSTLALTIRLKADSNRRRQARAASARQNDRKCAAANDLD
jgi:hypothetical protein